MHSPQTHLKIGIQRRNTMSVRNVMKRQCYAVLAKSYHIMYHHINSTVTIATCTCLTVKWKSTNSIHTCFQHFAAIHLSGLQVSACMRALQEWITKVEVSLDLGCPLVSHLSACSEKALIWVCNSAMPVFQRQIYQKQCDLNCTRHTICLPQNVTEYK